MRSGGQRWPTTFWHAGDVSVQVGSEWRCQSTATTPACRTGHAQPDAGGVPGRATRCDPVPGGRAALTAAAAEGATGATGGAFGGTADPHDFLGVGGRRL